MQFRVRRVITDERVPASHDDRGRSGCPCLSLILNDRVLGAEQAGHLSGLRIHHGAARAEYELILWLLRHRMGLEMDDGMSGGEQKSPQEKEEKLAHPPPPPRLEREDITAARG